jgi:hypothetical protein
VSYEEEIVAARQRRQEAADRKRAELQVDAEEAAARRLSIGRGLLAVATRGITSIAPAMTAKSKLELVESPTGPRLASPQSLPAEGRAILNERLRAVGLGGNLRTAPAPGRPTLDPNADPLGALSEEERATLGRNPKLTQSFLDRVAAAEAEVTAEREREQLSAEIWQAIDEREAAEKLAERVIGERAKARGR